MRICFLILSIVTIISGQNNYAGSRALFREALGAGLNLITIFENLDMEVVKIDMDLIGITNPKQSVKTLSAGFSYTITACGQPSLIKDLDIVVHLATSSGEPVFIAQDKAVDNSPTVTFTPIISGTYIISISAASMLPGYENNMGFYFLAVAHR